MNSILNRNHVKNWGIAWPVEYCMISINNIIDLIWYVFSKQVLIFFVFENENVAYEHKQDIVASYVFSRFRILQKDNIFKEYSFYYNAL